MTHRFSIQGSLGLMLLAGVLVAHAQEEAAGRTDAATGATGEAGPVLLELLEFIGEFTTEDGEWVDPAALLEVDDGELVDATPGALPVLGVAGAAEEPPAAPVENCVATRCE